jgi:hypothetical protein
VAVDGSAENELLVYESPKEEGICDYALDMFDVEF